MAAEGLDAIIKACSHLENLNLTSCRGVDVAHRRRYFEVNDCLVSRRRLFITPQIQMLDENNA